MQLVEKHIIKKGHKFYVSLDDLCFKSKNLYNATLYAIRQYFFENEKYLKYKHLQPQFQNDNNPDYRALNPKAAQQTMRMVDKNFKSFFSALKSYQKNPEKFNAAPQLPKYLHKSKGRFLVTYTNQNISKKIFDKTGKIKVNELNFEIDTQITNFNSINQVRVVPRKNYYIIEVVYTVNEIELKKDNRRYCGIDLGVNNLAAVSSNVTKPFIINGKPIKSINHYYNKQKAKYQSLLPKDKHYSNRLYKLELKRKNLIDNYLHKASRLLVNHLVSNEINTLIIGHNKQWKQDINKGKVNNQNFVYIPFNRFIQMLQYKCKFEGINVIITEESYTSKSSFLDNDYLPVYKQGDNKEYKFSGKRVKRGLYKTLNGSVINADINGSLNIIRKVIPNVVITNEIQVCSTPVMVTLQNQMNCYISI